MGNRRATNVGQEVAAAASMDRLKALYRLSMTLSGDPVEVFERAARMIGELLDVRVVCLSEIRGDELHFLSVYIDGQVTRAPGHCPLAITPCATVQSTKDVRVYDRVQERFPEALFLKQHDAYSYCGFPSVGSDGKVVAATCLLDDKPHYFSDEDLELLRIFGQRIGLEIERYRHQEQRKRAETALRESEARLSGILNIAPEAIVSVDGAGRIQLFNKGAEAVFGYKAEELLGRSLDLLLPHRVRSRHRAHMEAFLHASEAGRLMSERSEIVGQRSDGTEFPAEASISKLETRGEVVLTAMLRDVSERKRAEAVLHRQAETLALMSKIAVAANEAFSVSSATEVFLAEICRFAGWPVGHLYELSEDNPEELISTGFWHFDEAGRFDALRQRSQCERFGPGSGLPGRVLASGKPCWLPTAVAEAELPHAGPASRCGLGGVYAFPVMVGKSVAAVLEFFAKDAGDPDQQLLEVLAQAGAQLGRVIERQKAAVALCANEAALTVKVAELETTQRDLTKSSERLMSLAESLRLARDEAEAANRAKSEFLAAISHELRTPLNAIIGFSELMTSEALGPVDSSHYREYVQNINESGKHLLDLINDILDLSKIESGVDELREEIVQIPDLVGSVLVLVGRRAEEAGVALETEVGAATSALRADRRKLKQVLVNLLSNAIKFTRAGGKATLLAWCGEDSGFVFQIVDTGIGIAASDIPKALSVFRQIDGSLSRQHEGTGLGLPLSKALVEQHGGSLELQSEVGLGTTVTLRFPASRIVPWDTDDAEPSRASAAAG